MVKGIKSKRKIKEKEKRSPDPGHYWPDPDAGPGSGPLWPGFWFRIRTRIRICGSWSRCGLNARTFRTFYGLFTDLPDSPDSILYLKDMLRLCVWRRGESAFVKIWVKRRKIVVPAPLLLDCVQVFYTSRGGGSEAPIHRMARWGLQVNIHTTSFIKINFNPRVCFTITFFTQLFVRAVCTWTYLDGGLNIKQFNRKHGRQFFTWYSVATGTQCSLWKNWRKVRCGSVNFLQATDCQQKRFIVGRKNRVDAHMPRFYQVFNRKF